MTRRSVAPIGVLLVALTACDRTPAPSAPTTTPDSISAFIGTWRSSTPTGACTSMNWSVARTGAATATIIYAANCAGVPVTGTANATSNGTTLDWTTTGTAATACAFTLNGTAAPATTPTDLDITYTGTVCGAPVSGRDTLHR